MNRHLGPALPESTRRLFPHDQLDRLTQDSIIERLFEEGDGADLRWLAEHVGEEAMADGFRRFGHPRLSRRSERFWRLVLLGSLDSEPSARDLWPL